MTEAMGNWMTMQVLGTCAPEEVAALRTATYIDLRGDMGAWPDTGPLCVSEGLCGLGDWPAASMASVGNAFERDYDAESVANQLRALVKVAPSLALKVHCGGDYESSKCVATVTVVGGRVGVGPAEIAQLPEISGDLMVGRFMKAIRVGS